MTDKMDITNSESLREKIHELHNYMRNNGIGYGMTALKVFSLFYGLKKIDELNLYHKIGLTDENCKWSYLLKLAKTNDKSLTVAKVIDEIILEKIHTSDKCSKLKLLLGYDIPRDLRDDVYNHLIKEIDTIPEIEKTSGELLSGKIYEYFVGRDQSAISELGAYFTNRRIVNHILNKIKININSDGSIPKMIDMFGGSGGFTLGYMSYLNSKFEIHWNSQLDNIYHFDINQDVIKSVALEFFCLSNGIIPTIGNTSSSRLRRINSFKWHYGSNDKFKLILTNPPYGGDKIGTSAKKEKRDKIIKYIQNEINEFKDKLSEIINDKKIKSIDKLIELVPDIDKNEILKIKAREHQLARLKKEEKIEKDESKKMTVNIDTCSTGIQKFAGKYKLTGNDKESCSLMLIMDLLDIDGTAVGVLKEGLFFDSTYSGLRRVLIENFNVKEIISVPQNQFENTSTKTSIVIFNNDGDIKTSTVNFSELIVDTYDKDEFAEINNEICLTINKGDIKEVREEFITSVSVNQILANETCSLNSKDYNKVSLVCGDDFKLVRIGDIFKIENGKLLKNIVNGNYPIYGGGTSIIGFHNEYNRENSIIISQIGSCGFISFNKNKFYANNNCFTFTSHIDNNNEYYYYICKCMEYIFKSISIGSVQQVIKINIFKELEIPIPKTQELIDYWVDKISTPFNLKQEKEKRFKELEDEIKMKIKDIQENSDCEDVKLGDICNINPINDKINKEYINYIDISSVKEGTINNIIKLYKNYPSRAKRTIIYGDILFSTVRPNLKGYAYIVNCDNNLVASTGFVVIRANSINYLYIYNLLLFSNITEYLINNTSGSSYPSVKPDIFKNFKIKIPKDKSLIDNLEPLFNEVEELQKEIKELDKIYNNYLQELAKSAIKNYDSNDYKNQEDDNISNEDEEEIKSIKSDKSLTVSELKEQCKSLGIKGYSKKTKEELIEIIKNYKN